MEFTKEVADPWAEIRVQPHLPCALAPRFLGCGRGADGKTWMRFERVNGWHPDLTPDSDDLPAVVTVLDHLSRVQRPDLPVFPAARRWAPFGATDLIAGETLVHTDLWAGNILLTETGAKIIDWEWPTLGAPWLDSATMVIRLIQAGHDPAGATEWMRRVPAYRAAGPAAVSHYMDVREQVARRRNRAALVAAYERWRADFPGTGLGR